MIDLINDQNLVPDSDSGELQPVIDDGTIIDDPATPILVDDPIPSDDPLLGIDNIPTEHVEQRPIGGNTVGGFDCSSGCAGNCAGSCNWMCQNSAYNTPI